MSGYAVTDSGLTGHEDIIGYWSSLRRGDRLPGRRDIDPVLLKRHLPTISLTDVWRDPLDFRFRLAGTGLYPLYGQEITGRKLEDVYSPDAAAYWRGVLEAVAKSGRPNAGRYQMRAPERGDRTLLWLRLPLASDGRTVDMVLGYDVIVGPPLSFLSGIKAA